MASIRRLKKDMDYLTFAVVDDCLNCLAYGKDSDDMAGIVEEVINKRNELRQRVNAGRSLAKAERKKYYQGICKDMMISIDGAFSKLSEVVKKNA